jgi:hypothetical protein
MTVARLSLANYHSAAVALFAASLSSSVEAPFSS